MTSTATITQTQVTAIGETAIQVVTVGTQGPQGATGPSGASTFDAIGSGINTTANMVVGSGASMTPAGTGNIQANNFVAGSTLDSYIIAMAAAL